MESQQGMTSIAFDKSGERADVAILDLYEGAADFLDHYTDPSLLGRDFCDLVGVGSGRERLSRLIKATGYPGDAQGFFSGLMDIVSRRNGTHREPVEINGVELPRLLLLAILEKALPGNGFVSVKDVEQLEKLANLSVEEPDRSRLQEVIDTYPVRLSRHVLRQVLLSGNVAYQYLPFVEELDPAGFENTWIGQFHQGLLERMYKNRVIFLLNMSCPVYCRFCFRKHKDLRNEPTPTAEEVQQAVDYVAGFPQIKEVVITGGDPFLHRGNMACALDGLGEVPHMRTLRLATRSVAYYPHLFLGKDRAWLSYLKRKNLELEEKGKRIEVATHLIHPDEISLDSLEIITELVRNGIQVYVQTPFLRACNDEGPELKSLFKALRGAGAEMHYIYIPCSPIQGNSVYWNPISKGVAAATYLRAHLSDRAIPRLCTATPVGKLDWNSSGWAVEKDAENERFIWIRSPYTPGYFKDFATLGSELANLRVNEEGTLDVQYMVQLGDEALFQGARGPREVAERETDVEALKALQQEARKVQPLTPSLVPTGRSDVSRVHETRVELDVGAGLEAIEYIREHEAITDVVIGGSEDVPEGLQKIASIMDRLRSVPHVNVVRLRSPGFTYAPAKYTRGVVQRLGELNWLTVVRPLRLEIEALFLHETEIGEDQKRLAADLRRQGISVYMNIPVLSSINDSAEALHRVAYACRDAGMEFHHVCVAGHPLQGAWNRERPVDVDDVIDMATRVRREGSGREIPAYILLTELGEVDFGLTSRFFERDGALWAKLLCYDRAYYQDMDPGFSWPEGVREDADSRPWIRVPELKSDTGFMVF